MCNIPCIFLDIKINVDIIFHTYISCYTINDESLNIVIQNLSMGTGMNAVVSLSSVCFGNPV